MSASSTHDTKRGEDVRARINVLSETPGEWYRAIRRWRELNRSAKTRVDDRHAPDANEEYLLYQTLVGTWPLYPMNPEEHRSIRSKNRWLHAEGAARSQGPHQLGESKQRI